MEEKSENNISPSKQSLIESNSHMAQEIKTKLIDHEFELLPLVIPECIDGQRLEQALAASENAAVVHETGLLNPKIELLLRPRAHFDEELANTWVMCLANLVAGNTAAMDQLCTYMAYDEIG